MYKQYIDVQSNQVADKAIIRLLDSACIPFVVDNSDFANFKKEVLAGAELQDANGNVMTDAAEYVRTLP
jgi:hypothetical protein